MGRESVCSVFYDVEVTKEDVDWGVCVCLPSGLEVFEEGHIVGQVVGSVDSKYVEGVSIVPG